MYASERWWTGLRVAADEAEQNELDWIGFDGIGFDVGQERSVACIEAKCRECSWGAKRGEGGRHRAV